MLRYILSAALLANAPVPVAQAYNSPGAAKWEIGPIIRGRNYSVGMPLQPTPARQGWYFDFPFPDREAGHVHYVTFRHGSLAGKRRITMRYRIDAARGTRFVPQETPQFDGAISLYFQRSGDRWSAKRDYQFFRWYAPQSKVLRLAPGEFEISVDLGDPEWISVMSVTSGAAPDQFRDAVVNADRIGFTLGGYGDARGHGVFATAPARLTVLSFTVT